MLLRRRSVNVMVLQEAPRGESPAFFSLPPLRIGVGGKGLRS